MSPSSWRRVWGSADLRIVTGSRTLLQALADGGPFLYFNGISGSGRRARRHRPEKVAGLLRLFQTMHVPPELCRDLDRFSRGRQVAEVVRRAAAETGWAGGFPSPKVVRAAVPTDAGVVLRGLARAWGRSGGTSADLVLRFRRRAISSEPPRPARS